MSNIVVLPNRSPVHPTILLSLTCLEVDAQRTAKATFTAYDITMNLRQANPTLEIVHAEVREFVHEYMDGLNDPNYISEIRSYPGGDALTYIPFVIGVVKPAPAQLTSGAIDWDN